MLATFHNTWHQCAVQRHCTLLHSQLVITAHHYCCLLLYCKFPYLLILFCTNSSTMICTVPTWQWLDLWGQHHKLRPKVEGVSSRPLSVFEATTVRSRSHGQSLRSPWDHAESLRPLWTETTVSLWSHCESATVSRWDHCESVRPLWVLEATVSPWGHCESLRPLW